MTDPNQKPILSAGHPPLEQRYGEPTTRMTFTLPVSMHKYLMKQEGKAAEYLRQLIAKDMSSDPPSDT